jgi:hypothetical protein
MSDDFFMVLPSNTICKEYPDNKTSKYTIKLPKVVHLEGVWEVALSEIHYPHTFLNIESEHAWIKCFKRISGHAVQVSPKLSLESGYYSGEEIYRELNDKISRSFKGYRGKFKYNARNNKLTIALNPREKIQIGPRLARSLGFMSSTVYGNLSGTNKVSVSAEFSIDLNLAVHNIYVYTDIVKDTLVGNIYTTLLRIVSVESKPGTHISRVFSHLYYHQVNTNNLSQIEISTKDNQGQLIKYQSGEVIVKLHFRKKILSSLEHHI